MNDKYATTLAHCMLMQRLKESVDLALSLHPEYNTDDLIGHATLIGYLTERIDKIIHERRKPTPT
jgi:hypothetical protein